MRDYHEPVLAEAVAEGLNITNGAVIVDATLGGGGHTEVFLKHGAYVFGIDTDREAVEHTDTLLKDRGYTQYRLVQGNFRNIAILARDHGLDRVDGILFDLGVSSHQLDTPRRGFTYRDPNAPLDMRFDQSRGSGAAELIRTASREELYEIFSAFGEEKHSRAIADAIHRAGSVTPITTSGQVRDAIKGIVGGAEADKTSGRIFQALRMAVNDELNALKAGLSGAETLLRTGGRLAVISFHSREDRVVKLCMRGRGWHRVTAKPVTADAREYARNPRSHSAKLRIAEKQDAS